MVLTCDENMKGFFNLDMREKEIAKKGHRVNWPRFCKNDDSLEAVKKFKTVDVSTVMTLFRN